jgi:phosphate starvation-inducible protein PhoH and related proteins
MATKRLHLNNQEEAMILFGQNDQNLRELESRYQVQFFVRPSTLPSEEGLTLAVRGRAQNIDKALAVLEARRANPQTLASSSKTSQFEMSDSESRKSPMIIRSATGTAICPRTETQQNYIKALNDNDMVIAIGPAGTGKTFLAVAFALAELQAGRVSKIILSRPVVEAGEKLGFLPGDLYEKVHPYLRPLYDAFYTIVGPERLRLLREDEIVEIAPLAYMRGRTLDNSLIILDEAQNTTPEQMKMFLTRMGQKSKMIINGDLTQIDLEDKKKSGLVKIEQILKGVPGINFIRFSGEDIVRHQLVQRILKAYDQHENGARGA